MSIISAFSDWLCQCPQLDGQRLGVNHLGLDLPEWALIEAPTTPVLRRYANGGQLKQKAVALTAVEDRSPDVLMQLQSCGIWESITQWVQEQNSRRRNLPTLGDGRTCRSVEVTATHSVISTSAQTARFQIQFMITYEERMIL